MDGMTEIATKKDQKSITIKTDRPATPLDIVNHAMQSGREISLDQIEKLYELQERHEKNEARKAFNVAMNRFKSNQIVIKKTAKGHNNMFAPLDEIVTAVTPILSENGLSLTWDIEDLEKGVRVSAVISHEQGHSQRISLTSMPDKSGGKSDIHALGSIITYLQRYTACPALGIAASGDDDGQKASDKVITEKQHSEIVDMMNAKNIVEADFLVWLNSQKGTSISDMAELPSQMYGFVVSTIKSVSV